jgi:hypothetical protein
MARAIRLAVASLGILACTEKKAPTTDTSAAVKTDSVAQTLLPGEA